LNATAKTRAPNDKLRTYAAVAPPLLTAYCRRQERGLGGEASCASPETSYLLEVIVNLVPQIVPISTMRLRHKAVLNLLDKGPVILAQHSKGAAVLVSIEQWNALIHELEALDDKAAIYRHKWLSATNQNETETIAPEALEVWLRDDEKIPA